MELIKKQFNKIAEEHPYWSSYLCFTELCQKIKMSPYQIGKWLNILVNEEDYDRREKKTILSHLLENKSHS